MTTQKRQSILCPNCRRLISVDEPACPYCHTTRPGSRLKNNPLTRGLQSPEQAVRTIVYVNIGMFAISLLLNPMLTRLSLNPLAFLSPENNSLLLMGATGTIPVLKLGRWWTILSANYLHGSVLHIFFNMFALKQIAPVVITEFGLYRMFIIYTVGGVAGYALSCLAGVPFTIGASASLCGLIGATLYFGKSRGGVYGQALYRQLGGWTLGIFLFGFLVPGINNWGHGGGLAAGALLGMIMGYKQRRPETVFHKQTAVVLAILTGIILAWAILSALYYRVLG